MSAPNALVYIMDSARYDDFIAIYTRFTHAAKRDFVWFPNSYSFGTWTKPASSSILFGLPARVTGMKLYNDAIPHDLHSVYAPLRQPGYSLNLITTNVIISSAFGYDEYYDYFRDTFSSEKELNLQQNLNEEVFELLKKFVAGHNLRIVPSEVLHADFLHHVEQQQDQHITFLWSMDTHDPYYDLDCDEAPRELVTNREIRQGDLVTLEKAHRLHQRSIEYNLNSFFTLLGTIDPERYQDMLIFLISDHGEAFGEKPYVASFRNLIPKPKPIVSHDTFPIQQVIRIPFLVKFPRGWRRECNTRQVVTTNAILPTIFDVLRVEPQAPLFGTSLFNQRAASKWEVVSEHFQGTRSYVAIVDERNSCQFIEDVSQSQASGPNLVGVIKHHLWRQIQLRYGPLGGEVIDTSQATIPDAAGKKKALADYLRRCSCFHFEHSKIEANSPVDDEVVQRLRALGYVE